MLFIYLRFNLPFCVVIGAARQLLFRWGGVRVTAHLEQGAWGSSGVDWHFPGVASHVGATTVTPHQDHNGR